MSQRRLAAAPRAARRGAPRLALVWLLAAAGAQADAGPAAKEFSPDCLPAALPVQPTGATASREVVDADGGRLRVTLWRVPCTTDDAQAILTFVPVSGRPRVGAVRVAQAGRIANFPDLISSVQPLTFLFGPLDTPTSALLSVTLDPPFDDDCAFEVQYLPPGASAAFPLALGAEPGAACVLSFGAAGAALSQRLAGTWFDPARAGEGVATDFLVAEGQRIAFLSWYTYEGGQQRYLVGNAPYAQGDRSVRLGLVETGGAQFGAAFRPEAVTRRAWGEATLSFPDCGRLLLSWRRADGLAGELRLVRLGGADGVACP
ncbi:MAG: hypothetical protein ACK55W_02685 [Pseudomonadota bacterium]